MKFLPKIDFKKPPKQKSIGNIPWLTIWPEIKTSENKTHIVLPSVPILLGFVVAFAIISWLFIRNTQGNRSQQETMMKVISSVIELPNESPQIALVSDASLLINQPFFASAQNGDYVIVYQQSQKVLLYRPSTKKIINFANVQTPTSEETGRFQLNN